MSGVMIPFGRPLLVPRIEISSANTRDGKRIFFVDLIEADGCCGLWDGADLNEAREAAACCELPIFDLTNPTVDRKA